MVNPRFKIGLKTKESIETALERLNKWLNSPSTRSRNRLVYMVEAILQECQPESTYAAITATIVLTESDFIFVITKMKEKGIWQEYLETMLEKANHLKLKVK